MMRSNAFLSLCLALALCLLNSSCGDSPTSTPGPDDTRATGQVDPSGDSEFLLGTVTTSPTAGRAEVWARNLRVESDEIVSFDAVIVNRSTWPVHAPIHFVITEIRPAVVEVTNPDMTGPDGPVFDFSDDLGDRVLAPGEASAPVNMKFRWPEPMAFAIGFRVDAGGGDATGFISGVVFNDRNGDGRYDMNLEPGIPGVVVEMVPSVREILYRTLTDDHGRYRFGDLAADVYRVTAHGFGDMQPTTPNPLIISLVERPDSGVTSFDKAHFGFLGALPPPPATIFGPIPVGPGSPSGTEFDSTFVIPDFFAAVDLFLNVIPPPFLGPFPLHIDEATVAINDVPVWEFVCEPPDSVCVPSARVLLNPELHGENAISIRVFGDPMSFLLFSIEAETILPE